MYQPPLSRLVRDRIITAEVMKLEQRQARERAAHPTSASHDFRDLRAEGLQRRS